MKKLRRILRGSFTPKLIFIVVCVAAIIFLLNLERIKPNQNEKCVNLNGEQTCHSTDPDPFRYYGTKTAYHEALDNSTDSSLDPKDCVPKVFYLLSRHATRYPEKASIELMLKALPVFQENILNASLNGQVKMCPEDVEKIRNWTVKLKPEDDNRISYTGATEAAELAKRLKKRFSIILDQPYSPDKFTFEYTSRGRTRSTAEAFSKGMFPNNKNIDFGTNFKDDVLQFNKGCKKLQEKCGNDTIDISEVENFESGPLMEKMLASVSKRVGFSITPDGLRMLYLSCAFGHALDTGDEWCALFSSEELQVMEYCDDIDDYYKDAYGNRINHEQACPVAKYLVDLFKSYENSSERKITFHFSHAGAIKKVYAMFGLFQDDDPLTADSFCSRKDRKWRSSLIAPFNSNIIFVLYECNNVRKVAAFHNEKLLRIGGCGSTLCPINHFYDTYDKIAKNCDMDRICRTCRF